MLLKIDKRGCGFGPKVDDPGYASRGVSGIASSTSRTHARPAEHCIIDIVGAFVRVSCPTETDRPRDRDKQTETDVP